MNNFHAKKIIIKLIAFYQITISPDHGVFRANYPYGFCRHYPSCSEYTKNAVASFGVLRGLRLGLKRILRCNPWVEPSIDVAQSD
ncbi:MAG: membrane protein insertion efficiency factor YidD [Patescibacteria group bacterium]